tara:strand:- start:124 stop:486 length:363 start_codon:yes stop_codon:yes gene_type:complete
MLQTLKKSNMNLKMIACSSCGEPMPELRLTRAGFSYCVICSENGLGAGRKQGIPVLMGEGDHTWVETVIMDADQYEQYIAQEKAELKKDKSDTAEKLDFDQEDKRNLQGPFQIINTEEDA